MATEPANEVTAVVSRRACLAALLSGLPLRSLRAAPGTRIVAAWQAEPGWRLGLLAAGAGQLRVLHALELPTRAHGLLTEAQGTVLAVARRPGDWLLRWRPGAADAQWVWANDGCVFNGHVLASADGKTLYTTETDLQTGAGRLGVRDARSLAKVDQWATHGLDPHELVLGPEGDLWVANGGIATQLATGRAKRDLAHMDSSLVRLSARDGALRGQWRLADARLGLRHLAWGRSDDGRPVLGAALQAEHDSPEAKAAAPVLALFDGTALQLAPAPMALGGYGGGIGFAGGGFAVSCTRRDGVARFDARGRWIGFSALESACALDGLGDRLWAAGSRGAIVLPGDGRLLRVDAGVRLDNHWRLLG